MKIVTDDLLKVTEETFRQEVLEAEGPVLVNFYLSGHQPSRMMVPTLETVASRNPGVKICRVEVEDCPALVQRYNIYILPTTISFLGGKTRRRCSGLVLEAPLEAMIRQCGD